MMKQNITNLTGVTFHSNLDVDRRPQRHGLVRPKVGQPSGRVGWHYKRQNILDAAVGIVNGLELDGERERETP
jgi:protoporphyrinogen oxidase